METTGQNSLQCRSNSCSRLLILPIPLLIFIHLIEPGLSRFSGFSMSDETPHLNEKNSRKEEVVNPDGCEEVASIPATLQVPTCSSLVIHGAGNRLRRRKDRLASPQQQQPDRLGPESSNLIVGCHGDNVVCHGNNNGCHARNHGCHVAKFYVLRP